MPTRRLKKGVTLAVLLALGLWCGHAADATVRRQEPTEPESHAILRAPQSLVVAPQLAARSQEPPSLAPREVVRAHLIRSVRFTPERPCAGEEVVAHVDLVSAAPETKVFVNGQPGSPQRVRARAPGVMPVRILARTWGDQFDLYEAELEVGDCREHDEHSLAVLSRDIGQAEYAFALQPVGAQTVSWDFGDGTSARGNPVRHRYATRVDRAQSNYLVSAHYETSQGQRSARTVVAHAEPIAIAARTAFPVLGSDGPRFVAWNERAEIDVTRDVHNHLGLDVSLSQVALTGFPCDGSEAELVTQPAYEVVDRTRIPRGSTLSLSLQLKAGAFTKSICQVLVRLAGSAGDRLVTSTFALETGAPDERLPLDEEMREAVRATLAQRGPQTRFTEADLALHQVTRAVRSR